MRSKFKWIFTLLVALSMQFSFAQNKTVSGVVSDNSGPLPGANVVVKGTTRGVQTDMDGKYSIQTKVGETLVFSFIGMEDQSKVVGASNTISVKLGDASVKLGEVVIDGYRSVSKVKSSVAQTTVTAKTIENRPNVSFLQSIQAQVPGLYIATSSGSPGSAKTNTLIRGVASINASSEPLYVIDGVPAPGTVFRGLNPNDIESVTVLKDAAASAIYGNRASGGVIVVKTKNGKLDSKLVFRYSGTTGTTQLQDHDYGLPNTREILRLERDAGSGLGATGGVGGAMTDDEINAFPIDTDWKKIFFRTGRTQSHDISIQGGSKNLTNYTSLSYFEQDGIVPTTDFKRFSIRSNFTGKSDNDKFSYGTNIYTAYSKRHQLDQETRTDINANVLQNPLQGLLTSLPYLDPNTYQNGIQLFNDFGAPSFQIVPFMLMDYLQPGNIPSMFEETKMLINGNASYKLTKSLTFTQTAGIDFTQSNRDFARAPWSYLALAAQGAAQFGGIEVMQLQRDLMFNSVSKLNYNKSFGKHTIDANAFFEYIKGHRKIVNSQQNGLDPRTWAFGAGTGFVPFNTATPTLYQKTFSASKVDVGLLSYFGTVDYDYDTRFGVAGTIRRDASSKFSDLNRWGTFWSASARWNIDNEKFFQDNKIFNELKLRVSYGSTGNQYLNGGTFTGANLIRDTYASTTGYGNAPSLTANISNPQIEWETTTQTDLGLDFGIKSRVSGAFDIYRKRTTQLFDDRDISYVNGQTTLTSNVGSLMNKGVELNLRYDMFKNTEFKLELYGNGSYNRARWETTNLQPGDQDQPNGNLIRYVGGLVNEYYLVPVYGVNPANGNLWFLDINDNIVETVTDADRRKTGKSNIPTYQGGFGFNSSYKGFFLNTQFSYAADVWRFDFDLTNLSDPTSIGVFPVTTDLLDAWTPTNTSSQVPSLTATNLVIGDDFSDRWLRDASYVRLKVLTVGYNVPAKFLDGTLLTSVRVYSLLENYITWTKWRGFDAESFGASNQGGYPAPKTLTFGLDVQF